jgi:hypothetical protein
MIIRGTKISGLNFIGKKSLSSIGNLLFQYDYRKSIQSINYLGIDLVVSLGDLSKNNFNLSQGQFQRRPQLYSDGIGTNVSAGASQDLIGIPSSLLKVLHDGTPHLLFAVARYSNPSNLVDVIQFVRTGGVSVSAGIDWRINGSSNQLSHRFLGDSGISLTQHQSGLDTVSEGTDFKLIMYVYYGDSISNNGRHIISNQSYYATRSLTLSDQDTNNFRCFITGGVGDVARIKTVGCYDLSGKNVSEINLFIDEFIELLKEDTEYSTLITI